MNSALPGAPEESELQMFLHRRIIPAAATRLALSMISVIPSHALVGAITAIELRVSGADRED
jgi:hypothetical protein